MSGVTELFLELAAIPSPPGGEDAVAAVVARYLRDLGLAVEEDALGNLYARIEPTADGAPLLGRHARVRCPPVEGDLHPLRERSAEDDLADRAFLVVDETERSV